ncbi:hypothetical protein D3P07_01800 [Paenibacillus sp. 1011MAR3C5]|uniref:hypothetical protein n=1 Tax=Paenibacillus sp. 1011MAR3C5 TaxID=1675787 RepID=UPI000E6C9956|nr:hypothetical protein [Paenibacillus sp. 1011MAR3C5]RJE90849.1 hypothetical protein D3P07_01800 [Paenibacillus sp. 1011MAR3C5]
MNLFRNAHHYHRLLLVPALALTVSLAACQSPDKLIENKPQQNSGNVIDSPQKSYDQKNGATAPPTSHQPDPKASTETSSLNKTGPGNSGQPDQWNLESPRLKGVAIGDSNEVIHGYFGQAEDSYHLEEEAESIRVLEYDGFSIGLDQGGFVHFVEVFGSDTLAGLSGLRIGDEPEKALKELGKPDSRSDYLFIYDAAGATLKLDVNPDRDEIVSMKLLAQG